MRDERGATAAALASAAAGEERRRESPGPMAVRDVFVALEASHTGLFGAPFMLQIPRVVLSV